MPADALREVRAFCDAGLLGALEVRFAETMARLGGEDDPRVLLAAALACLAPSRGHICVDLKDAARLVRLEPDPADPDGAPVSPVRWPDPESWRAALAACAGRPGAVVRMAGPGASPLVLEGDRLYLDRYWDYEQRLARKVVDWTAAGATDCDAADVDDLVDRLFPGDRPGADGLRRAARAVATRRFAIIAGGPGTGKTTTVTRILAMLLELGRRAARGTPWTPPRVALMAPTGKAAARMKETIRNQMAALRTMAGTGIDPSVLAEIRVEASTLHRALGAHPDHPTRFRFGADNLLPVGIAIVDEASMIDFAMMTRLVEAIPPTARLILLGDRDQLASVEAGAVLGDLCGDPDRAEAAGPDAPPIAGAVAFLRHPFRFGADTGIGALSRAIRARRADRALAYLRGTGWEPDAPPDRRPYRDLVFHEVDAAPTAPDAGARRHAGPDGFDAVKPVVLDAFLPMVAAAKAGDAAAALEAQQRFCVLTPHRRGRLGVEGLNRRVEGWLARCDPPAIDDAAGWYLGRPILIMRNDASLDLFNGDLGVIVAGPDGAPRAAFQGAEPGSFRLLHPGRLPPHETVFAMTVHKSQGSQFGDVLLVLPEQPSPILTRELLYTAVTRAEQRVRVVGGAATIEHAIGEEVLRFSGLRAKVWGGAGATGGGTATAG